MKYLIVTLLKGEAARFQQQLLHDIAERFSVSGAIERKPPAHITLKYSFETDRIAEVEHVLQEFCEQAHPCPYRLEGYGHFETTVLFIEVIPSPEMQACYQELIAALKTIPWMPFKEFDGNTHFHSSLAHTDIEKKFDDIHSYLSRIPCSFSEDWDAIALLRLENGLWVLHKEFPFNTAAGQQNL